MKGSKTILLTLLALGLGAYIWFYEMHQLSSTEQKALERQAFGLQVEQIDGIGIRTPDYEVEMFKTDFGWELRNPKGARAATPVVKQLLARIRTLDKGELITPADIRAKGHSLAEFGLSVPRIKLMLKTPAQTLHYEVGDKNPLGNSVYVKETSTQNVMLVSTDLLEVLPDHPLHFRDKTIFPMHEEEVRALDLVTRGRTLRLEKREGRWELKTPVSAPADQQQVVALVQKLLQARIEGVVNDPGTETMETFARQEQVVRVWPVNSKVPVEIVVGGDLPQEPEMLLMRITGQEGLVKVSKGMRMLADSPVDLFRDRRLFAVDPQTVTAVEVERGGQTLRLEKTGTVWQVVDPVTMKASSSRVQNMIKTWMDARAERFLEDDTSGEVLTTVSFWHGGGEKSGSTRFEVLGEAVTPGRAMLRKSGESGRMVVVPDLVKYAPVEVLPYLSREILNFDPDQAVRLSLSHGGDSLGVVRGGAGEPWSAQHADREVNQERVNEILDTFSRLYAENLLELNPEDPAVYGLDDPQVRLSIGLAGEQAGNRTLLISRGGADHPGVVGIVQGQNLVFQLPDGIFELIQKPLGTAE